MLADPKDRRLILRNLIEEFPGLLPIEGGSTVAAADVCSGTFGTNCSPHGQYVFSRGGGVPDLEVASDTVSDTFGVAIRATGGSSFSALRLASASGAVQFYDHTSSYFVGIYAQEVLGILFQANGPSYFNGGLGIGTSSPRAKLHVQNTDPASPVLFAEAAASQTANLQEWQDSTGAALAVVDKSGKVGVGTTAPENKLDVAGDMGIRAGKTLKLYDSADLHYATVSGLMGPSSTMCIQASAPMMVSPSPPLQPTIATLETGSGPWDGSAGAFNGSASGTLIATNIPATFSGNLVDLQVAGVCKAVVTSADNVGIGTTTPLRKLHVVGAAGESYQLRLESASTTTAVSLELYAGSTARGIISAGATTLSIFNGSIDVTKSIQIRQDTGNVGVGTATPAEKLEVAGNIRSQGLNEIIFLRPTGSNDHIQIQMAINSLPKGGIIMLEPAFDGMGNSIPYAIGAEITINASGVKLRGYGGAGGNAVTELVWHGSSTDPMIGVAIGNVAGVQDIEISTLAINANNGSASAGLQIDAVTNSRFSDLSIYNLSKSSGIGLKLYVTTTSTLSWNLFERIYVNHAWKGLLLDSNKDYLHGVVNPAHNTFININVQDIDQYGIELGDCDNNSFHDVTTPGTP